MQKAFSYSDFMLAEGVLHLNAIAIAADEERNILKEIQVIIVE